MFAAFGAAKNLVTTGKEWRFHNGESKRGTGRSESDYS